MALTLGPGTQEPATDPSSVMRRVEHLAADAARGNSSPAFWHDRSCELCTVARWKDWFGRGIGDVSQGGLFDGEA